MRIPILSILLFTAFLCRSQVPEYKMSQPVNIPTEGWNKTLLMSNGNIMLFHFERRKEILVKIFDSTGKEIASSHEYCGLIDARELERCAVKGLYNIGSDAVLFLSQVIDNKDVLVRIRYSAKSGKLLSESVAVNSKSFENNTKTTVLKNRNDSGYAIVCFRNVDKIPGEKIQVVRFTGKDDTLNISDINIPEGEFKYITFTDANIDDRDNISVGLALTNVKTYGTSTLSSDLDKYFAFCYLPSGSTNFLTTKMPIPQRLNPYYTAIAYNAFTGNINCLFVNSLAESIRNGIERKLVAGSIPCFSVLDGSNLSLLAQQVLENKKAKEANDGEMDTNMKFKRPPLKMFTNEYGLTTIISEEQKQLAKPQDPGTSLGNICITQLNDNGEEMWGTVLRKRQLLEAYYSPIGIVKRHERNNSLFFGAPYAEYQLQFSSLYSFEKKGTFYILFNDSKSNFNKATTSTIDSVYDFSYTNAVYYTVDKKRMIAESYLFGTPADDESNACLIESADYKTKEGLFSCLVLRRKGKALTQHIARVRFN